MREYTDAEFMPDEMVCVWNVAFMPTNSRNWWRFLSPTWCRHVLAFGYVPATDCWIVIENGEQRMIVLAIPDKQFATWLDHLRKRQPRILRIYAKDAKSGAHRFGNWCSTTVGRLTGVRGGAWRPIALYRSLLRDGAKPVFGTSPHVIQGLGPEGRSRDEAAA